LAAQDAAPDPELDPAPEATTFPPRLTPGAEEGAEVESEVQESDLALGAAEPEQPEQPETPAAAIVEFAVLPKPEVAEQEAQVAQEPQLAQVEQEPAAAPPMAEDPGETEPTETGAQSGDSVPIAEALTPVAAATIPATEPLATLSLSEEQPLVQTPSFSEDVPSEAPAPDTPDTLDEAQPSTEVEEPASQPIGETQPPMMAESPAAQSTIEAPTAETATEEPDPETVAGLPETVAGLPETVAGLDKSEPSDGAEASLPVAAEPALPAGDPSPVAQPEPAMQPETALQTELPATTASPDVPEAWAETEGAEDASVATEGEATPDWAEQPTFADPPIWSEQPTYAEPEYAPLPQWSAAQPEARSTAAEPYPEYAPSAYAPSAYAAPPIASPQASAAAQVAAAYPEYAGPAYVAPVYAPPPTSTPRLRWPAVLLTVAALVVVVALSLVLADTVFSNFGKTNGVTTLYSNPMTSATNVWPSDQECAFRSDGYHITSAANCYYSGAAYQDVTASVTAKWVSGDPTGAYGIAFRRPSPNKYYVFLVTGDGSWLVARDNVAVVQAQHSTAIKTGVGAVNKLAVRMKGNHFTFFANGTQLGELTDSTYGSGNVGLAGDSSIEVAFRDFTVTQP
jgi:hypothetical protein